jgi:hypothetical protein
MNKGSLPRNRKGGGSRPALPTLYLKGGYFINRPCRTSSHFFTNWMMTLAIPSDKRYFCERFHVLQPLKLLLLLPLTARFSTTH